MYGQIGYGSGQGGWGEDPYGFSFRSQSFYDNTLEYLKRIASENNSILKKIRNREWDVERLAENTDAVKLGEMLREAREENEPNSEWTQKVIAAITWQRNADEIKKLRGELNDAQHKKRELKFPKTEEEENLYRVYRTKVYEAENALEWTIRKTVASDDTEWSWHQEWNKDYDFRDDFESFLSEFARARQCYRGELFHCFIGQGELYNIGVVRDLVQIYLDNSLWHLPQITTFLLVDLLDCDLLLLERDFYFGLFDQRISNAIKGPGSIYLRNDFTNVSPLAPKAKEVRRKSRLKNFLIGVGLTSLVLFPIAAEKIIDLWINQDFPAWIRVIRVILYGIWCGIGGPIAGPFLFDPMVNIIKEYINKKRIGYKRISIQAYKLQNIRWDISSGTYDAKTCIERLKKLDEQDLHISSLVYPLLELMKLLSDTSDDKTDASISPD